MGFNQTIALFVAQALFFIVVLTASLVFAARKHRGNLKGVVDHINKSVLFKQERDKEAKTSKDLLSKLRDKISRLQRQNSMLGKIEQKYYALKEKYDSERLAFEKKIQDLTNNLDNDNPDNQNSNNDSNNNDSDPSHIDLASKKKSIGDASQSVLRSSEETRVLSTKLEEQRAIIAALEDELSKAKETSEIDALKIEQNKDSLKSLKQLEEHLKESQKNRMKLENSLVDVKQQLQNATEKASLLELKQQREAETGGEDDDEGIKIEAKYTTSDQEDPPDQDDSELDLHNQEKIRSEVELLRQNTTQQRQLIFALEKELNQLRKNLKNNTLDEGDKEVREKQVASLEGLLRETEGCVEVLESEVSYLRQKLLDHDNDEDSGGLQELYEDAIMGLSQVQDMVGQAIDIRTHLTDIVHLSHLSDPQKALEQVSRKIMEAFQPLHVPIHLKIFGQAGEIDASNGKDFSDSEIELLAATIRKGMDTTVETEDGFITTSNHVGAFVKAPVTQASSLGKLRDTVNFIILVSSSIIAHIAERQAAKIRQGALKHLVESVREEISHISVQSKHQSAEANHIFNGLVNELNTSLNTMNITENQSLFFNQMIEENKLRMSLLLESGVVVDKSFNQLLDKIERSTPT